MIHKKIYTIIIILLFFGLTNHVKAVDMDLVIENEDIKLGSLFEISVAIDSKEDNINAL